MIPIVTGLLSASTGAEIAPSRVLTLTQASMTTLTLLILFITLNHCAPNLTKA